MTIVQERQFIELANSEYHGEYGSGLNEGPISLLVRGIYYAVLLFKQLSDVKRVRVRKQ